MLALPLLLTLALPLLTVISQLLTPTLQPLLFFIFANPTTTTTVTTTATATATGIYTVRGVQAEGGALSEPPL